MNNITRIENVNSEYWSWVSLNNYNCAIMVTKEYPTDNDVDLFLSNQATLAMLNKVVTIDVPNLLEEV